jgi:hypothetical protein
MSTEVNDEFDMSFANGSLKDLAMRMGDLDMELDEIATVSNGKNGNKNKVADDGKVEDDYDEDNDDDDATPKEMPVVDALEFSDGEDEDDDDDGLDDLTKELQQMDAAHAASCEEKEEMVAATAVVAADTVAAAPESSKATMMTMTATVVKPTPDSSIGLSMKTSKGMTVIIKMNPDGIVSQTNLQVGMKIIRINDTPIRNARHARELIQASPTEVIITCNRMTDSSSDMTVERGETTKKEE